MVLLHVKRSEESQFLHSCNVMDNVDEVLLKVLAKTMNISNSFSLVLLLACEHLQWEEEGIKAG